MDNQHQHTYPPAYPPGQHWALDEAWAILDTFTPGHLTEDTRTLLAGMIWGTLMRLARDGRIQEQFQHMTPPQTHQHCLHHVQGSLGTSAFMPHVCCQCGAQQSVAPPLGVMHGPFLPR